MTMATSMVSVACQPSSPEPGPVSVGIISRLNTFIPRARGSSCQGGVASPPWRTEATGAPGSARQAGGGGGGSPHRREEEGGGGAAGGAAAAPPAPPPPRHDPACPFGCSV